MRNDKKNLQRQDRTAGGFTIMELLVVSILMVIVMMITAHFWKWFSPGVSDLIAKEHLLREARLTMQSLAYDFGAASEISGGGQLLINSNIRYYRESAEDHHLYRQDSLEGKDFAIADCVSDISVTEEPLGSNLWAIALEFEAHSYKEPFRCEMVFHWSPPD